MTSHSRSSRPRRRFLPTLLFVGSWSAAALLCTSCTTLNSNYTDDVLDHAIVIKPDGDWADPRDKLVDAPAVPRPKNEMNLDKQLIRIAARIDEEQKKSGKTLKVLVFVHGGLHTWEASSEAYLRLSGPMKEAGYYPIFIVWNSGLVSSYGDRLWSVRQGEESRYLAPATAVVVAPIDLVTALVRAPLVVTAQLRTDLHTVEWDDSPQRKDHTAIEKFLGERHPENFGAGEDHRNIMERASHLCRYIVTFASKLALSPVIDGLGSKAWDMMLRRTQTMYHPPARVDIFSRLARERGVFGFDEPNLPTWREEVIKGWYEGKDVRYRDEHTPVGAMWAFSRALRHWSLKKDIEVHLFGHSMGTIVLNELFRQVPDIKVKRIGYLAAACTIRDWQNSVVPFLSAPEHADTRFYAACLHRMREQDETNALDLPPRGSLLNWIDNFLSNPNTIEDRTLGSWDNIVRAVPHYAFDGDGQPLNPQRRTQDRLVKQIHLRSYDALADKVLPLFSSEDRQPQKHGDFSDWPFWRDDFLWPSSPDKIPMRLDMPVSDKPKPLTIR